MNEDPFSSSAEARLSGFFAWIKSNAISITLVLVLLVASFFIYLYFQNKKEEKSIKDKNENEENSETITEDDEEGLNVSLAAMEEKLKPKVLKDFDEITKLFKKLQII